MRKWKLLHGTLWLSLEVWHYEREAAITMD